ncbi:MAG: hypothetical protein F6J86_41145 [Symploca sp. SIO1B1]|nr:hypothetical protein [Symploca sp. SIO1B1]
MPQQNAMATEKEQAWVYSLTSSSDVAEIPYGENHVHIYNEAPLYQVVNLSGHITGSLPDYLPTISPYGSLVFESNNAIDIRLGASRPIEDGVNPPRHVEVLYHSEGAEPTLERGLR